MIYKPKACSLKNLIDKPLAKLIRKKKKVCVHVGWGGGWGGRGIDMGIKKGLSLPKRRY